MKTKHTHKKKNQNVSNIVALSVHDSSQFRGYCNVQSANTELQVLLSFGLLRPPIRTKIQREVKEAGKQQCPQQTYLVSLKSDQSCRGAVIPVKQQMQP